MRSWNGNEVASEVGEIVYLTLTTAHAHLFVTFHFFLGGIFSTDRTV